MTRVCGVHERLPRQYGVPAFAGTTVWAHGQTAGTDSRPVFGHRVDKPVAGVGMALAARLQHVTQQEQAGQPKAVLQILIGPAVLAALAFAQKCRQPQQPVAPGFAGPSRYRAAGFRRDIDQIGGLAGRRAVFQIEPETEFGQHRQFESDQMRRRLAGIVEIVQRAVEHLVDVLVRIALRQQPRQRGQMGHAIDRMRRRQQGRRAQPRAFDRVGSRDARRAAPATPR